MTLSSRRLLTVVTFLLLSVLPIPARAQTWVGWSFHWENDTWVPAAFGADDAFTNGIRLVLGRGAGANLRGAGSWERLFPRTRNYDVTSALVLGQNFFTPRSITEFAPDPNDRPYAGFSYVGVRYDATSRLDMRDERPAPRQHQTQHSLELNAGVLGRWAAARKLQSGVHSVITTHRIPKGWSHQIDNAPGVSALYMGRTRWSWGWSDLTLHGGGLLGTTQTYPMAGATIRIGRGLSGFPGLLGRNTAVAPQLRHPLEFGVAGGVEGRYMLHNAFVEGALGKKGDPGVDPERPLGEFTVGLFLRVLEARLDYYFVRRSPEVSQPGPSEGIVDNYGSVAVSYEPGDEVFDKEWLDDFVFEVLPSWFEGFYLEGGFGSELSGDEPQTQATHVMHGAVGRRLWKDLDIGFERSGVGREFGPPQGGALDHRDRMLNATAITLRYRPLGGRYKQFDFHVRGGAGGALLSGGVNETELTPPLPGPRLVPCPAGFELDPPEAAVDKGYCNRLEEGTAYLLGTGLSWRPVGNELGLALDVLWADVGAGEHASFLGWSLGMRWTPNEP